MPSNTAFTFKHFPVRFYHLFCQNITVSVHNGEKSSKCAKIASSKHDKKTRTHSFSRQEALYSETASLTAEIRFSKGNLIPYTVQFLQRYQRIMARLETLQPLRLDVETEGDSLLTSLFSYILSH